MTILKILRHPDPRLRTVAQPVVAVNERIRRLVDDMLETMYAARGLGLSATQVDVHERVIVMDLSEGRDEPLVLINPELLMRSAEMVVNDEGCLSVPGAVEQLTRHASVKVRALNRDGEPFELFAQGLLAVCIQHELDHLSGQVFVDKLSFLRRSRILEMLSRRPRALVAAPTATARAAAAAATQ
jgi:peptide deformylase